MLIAESTRLPTNSCCWKYNVLNSVKDLHVCKQMQIINYNPPVSSLNMHSSNKGGLYKHLGFS